MNHRYLSTKVILPVADGSVLLAPEVLEVYKSATTSIERKFFYHYFL
jgi:hypothetical protein